MPLCRVAFPLLALLVLPRLAALQARPTPELEVYAVILRMFEGMRNADSAMVRSTLAPGARFASLESRRRWGSS